jgi:hypothetical protein
MRHSENISPNVIVELFSLNIVISCFEVIEKNQS